MVDGRAYLSKTHNNPFKSDQVCRHAFCKSAKATPTYFGSLTGALGGTPSDAAFVKAARE
jgi:hypothetical protein